ncbi:MAG: hypothetical protein HW387_1291 [Parachlamydiales bacterium]|nr:hypothetical protein [Parachlamydiales bacterium]
MESIIGHKIPVCGWVRTVRDQKSFAFIELNFITGMENVRDVIPFSRVTGSADF